MNITYYIYAYLRNKDSETGKAGTPYYIGKGYGSRAFRSHKHMPVPKDKSNIIFLETNLTELGALALERRMIRWYGRKDLGTGILCNMTDGGDGLTGRGGKLNFMFGKTHSNEVKARLSKAQKGKLASEETKAKMRATRIGMGRSAATREKMKQAWLFVERKHYSSDLSTSNNVPR